MNKYAVVFPGQGAQKSGMGKDLYDNSSAAKRVFDIADEVLGRKISSLCFCGTDEDLMKTINSQPCILAVEIAAFEALKEKCNIDIAYSAGHSLGEYAALYSAGVFDLKTVFSLIQKRAELMNEAAENTNGAMAAVIGLDDNTVIALTKTMDGVYVANYNSPGQVVITGDKDAINSNLEKFKEAGAKRVIPLSVSGAFHSPLMKTASEKFIQYSSTFKYCDSLYPVYTNVDAEAETLGENFKNKLPRQIYSSVLWTQTVNNITSNGIYNFIEIGPGKVLAGLNKKINSEINTVNIFDYESLENAVNVIKECVNV